MYTSGVWNVKAGKESEFARSWQAAVDGMSLDYPGVVFRLFRDTENPGNFVSIAGPWRNLEQIAAMRGSERFQESMVAIGEYIDSMGIATYELAAEVS